MLHLIDDSLPFYINTHHPETGAETDADSTPTYRIYEEETGTPILTGSFAKLDDANTVGCYSESVVLSAANGFEDGKTYCIRKTATVNGVTASEVERFKVADLSQIADYLLSRSVANVEDTASVNSLAFVILAMRFFSLTANPGFNTIYKTDGTTEFDQVPITTNPSAEPIVSGG